MKRSAHGNGWLWLMAATMAVLAGCRGSGGGSSATATSKTAASSAPTSEQRAMTAERVALIPQSRPPVADLPIPVGFKLVESVSRNYETAGSRFIDHTYQGNADKVDVERFYQQQMPAKGWSIKSSQMVRGVYLLRFERATEFCELQISGEPRTFGGEVTKVVFNVQTIKR